MAIERNIEFDRVDEVVRDAIIDETNGLTDRCAHGRGPFRWMRMVFLVTPRLAEKMAPRLGRDFRPLRP